MTPLLQVDGLVKAFGQGRALFGREEARPAVDHVSFDVAAGTTFGLVGESGSGKSTTARIIARLHDADQGSVKLEGSELLTQRGATLHRSRQQV